MTSPREGEEMIRALTFWLSTIMGSSLFVYLTAYRFTHPEMTETQLFLKLWPHGVGAGVFIWVAYFLLLMKRAKPAKGK